MNHENETTDGKVDLANELWDLFVAKNGIDELYQKWYNEMTCKAKANGCETAESVYNWIINQ